jgi:hypothetical protein
MKEATVFMKHIKFKGPKNSYVLNIGLNKTNHIYFAFTLDVLNSRGRYIGGGADHETMLKVFPELSKYINLHLSAETGVPMHAVDNGFYYLQNPHQYGRDVVAKHFRISKGDAGKLQKEVKSGEMDKEGLASYVKSQMPRWKKEAQQCIHWMASLDDSKQYKTDVTW